jgi:hypothetical protein
MRLSYSDSAHHLGSVQSKVPILGEAPYKPHLANTSRPPSLGVTPDPWLALGPSAPTKMPSESAECSAWFPLLATLGAIILAPAGKVAPSLNSTLALLL